MEFKFKIPKKNYFTINIKISIIYIIGSLFYYWSLARINTKEIMCLKVKEFRCFYMIAQYVLISSTLISITIYIIVFFKLQKYHLFNIFIIFIFFYLIDHDGGLVKHGIYNFLGFIFLSIFLLIFLCYTKCLCFLSKKLKYKNAYFSIFFLFK
jgi:hypothetical protein